jgi:hypothetical protein
MKHWYLLVALLAGAAGVAVYEWSIHDSVPGPPAKAATPSIPSPPVAAVPKLSTDSTIAKPKTSQQTYKALFDCDAWQNQSGYARQS